MFCKNIFDLYCSCFACTRQEDNAGAQEGGEGCVCVMGSLVDGAAAARRPAYGFARARPMRWLSLSNTV